MNVDFVHVLLLSVLLCPFSAHATSVKSISVISGRTGKVCAELDPISDGAGIDLSKIGGRLNMRANVDSESEISRVVFKLEGAQRRVRDERLAPYVLFGDDKGDYFFEPLSNGEYTLTCIAYTQEDESVEPFLLHFTVIRGSAEPPPVKPARAPWETKGSVQIPNKPSNRPVSRNDGVPVVISTPPSPKSIQIPGTIEIKHSDDHGLAIAMLACGILIPPSLVLLFFILRSSDQL